MQALLASQLDSAPSTSSTVSDGVSRRSLIAGRIISGLTVAFLAFDGIIKVVRIAPVVETFGQMGVPVELARGIGILQLACLALFLVRRTAVLGAVLITGFLGAAVMLHLRVGDPWGSHTLFPIYVGAFLWLGLYLRDTRVRALV